MASAGLAWSLANGITEAEYYENLRKSLITATENGVSDATIAKEMEKYGISAADLAKATGVATEVVQTKIDAVTTPGLLDTAEDVVTPPATSGAKTVTATGGGGGGLLTPDAVTPVPPVAVAPVTPPVVTPPVVTAPVTPPVTPPVVTAPVTPPVVRLPTTPITNNSPGLLTPTTPVTPPVVAPPVVAAPVTPPVVAAPATPTRSAGLTWSLNNGITEQQYYKKVADDYKRAVSEGLTDAQIRSTMDQYGISAADLATATGSDLKKVEERVTAAVPKTPAEIEYDKAAKAELAKRQALADAEKKVNEEKYKEQQRLNKLADEEQKRKNALDYAAQQKALADAERAKLDALRTPETNPFINAGPINPELPPGQVGFTQPTQPETGPLTFEENLKNYQSIPVGAQYNPFAVGGTGSPYSQIMAQAKPLGNPYANALAGQSMGGFNPALYAQAAATYKAEADAAAAAAASDPGQISDGLAKGGMVHGGLMFGPNPPGPDDGAVNLDVGEYVIKKSSVNKYGKGLLDMINEGKIPAKKIRSLLD
jgi:antitoxin component HigA of HigAB toxin-antitoxin module